MTPAIITQRQLLALLRDELGIRTSTVAVHAWIRDGMPLAPKSGKKPRFVWELVREWLLKGAAPTSPARQDARDRLFLASLRKGA